MSKAAAYPFAVFSTPLSRHPSFARASPLISAASWGWPSSAAMARGSVARPFLKEPGLPYSKSTHAGSGGAAFRSFVNSTWRAKPP